MPTQRELMAAGDWYCCLDDELDNLRTTARRAVHQHTTMDPDTRGAMAPRLAALFGQVGEGVFIESPFHCAYGFNIRLGQGVYINAGCSILDTGLVEIGAGSMLGPQVGLLCPEHAHEPAARAKGLEVARPIHIGTNVWIGGGATILGGVKIGDNAIIGAGAVVTRSVAVGDTVVGTGTGGTPRRNSHSPRRAGVRSP